MRENANIENKDTVQTAAVMEGNGSDYYPSTCGIRARAFGGIQGLRHGSTHSKPSLLANRGHSCSLGDNEIMP
jgi:hypothetical protein